MEDRQNQNQDENSDEIAAALSAVYAYCQIEEEQKANITSEQRSVSLWQRASRLESINNSAAKFVSAAQTRGNFFTWRNSFARRWTAFSIFSCLVILNQVSPVFALELERIQFDPLAKPASQYHEDSQQGDLRSSELHQTRPAPMFQPLCPVAPPMVVEISKTQSSAMAPNNRQIFAATAAKPAIVQTNNGSSFTIPESIRIALLTNTSAVEFSCPDGAQLVDETSQALLAELPPQSLWKVSIEGNSVGKRLAFAGHISHAPASRLLLAAGSSTYEPATFTRKFTYSGKNGFDKPPRVVNLSNPKFALTVKAPLLPKQPALQAASLQSGLPSQLLRPPGIISSSSTTKTGDPKQSTQMPAIPPVVNGYFIRPSVADGVLCIAGKTYRGSVLIKPRTDDPPGFLAINIVNLEDYLLSVVPSEMPSAWGLEALKAQSIAARSYAVANLGKHQSEGYDLKANTEDQVYLGVQTESEQSNRAVAETKGKVLTHNGKPITAFFHSAAGGHTEHAEHVWGSKLAYLKAVPDFDDQSPHFNWNRNIPVSAIEEALKKQGRDIGGLLGIFPLDRSPSQRVTQAMVAGTLQTLLLTGEELRKVLGLPSSVFNIGACFDSYLVAGRGFGHGLGMSQWGAKFLSEQGYNASQILSYYYKDVSIDQF